MKYFARFMLLALAFALTTVGLIQWHATGFRMYDLWPLSGPPALHPLHLLVAGIAMIAPALWEIFLLEQSASGGKLPTRENHPDGV